MEEDTIDVRFDVPEWVSPTTDEFDGVHVEVTYDSNFGGDVTVDGHAEIDDGLFRSDPSHLVVDGRHVRANRHVFNADGTHLGKVESIVVSGVDHDDAIDLVTDHSNYDVDRHDDQTVVQMWDDGVIQERGFMAGTASVTLSHV